MGKFNDNSLNGYFDSKIWHSAVCDNKIKTIDGAKHCLRNKAIYFIGDSTCRQLHLEIVSYLKIPDKVLGPSPSGASPRRAEDPTNNIVTHYKPHGLPMRSSHRLPIYPPVVETLNKINIMNGKDIIIVFHMGPHFALHHPSVIIHQIFQIRRAMQALKKRVPNIKILVKGAVRHKANTENQPSEWPLYRSDLIMRQFFSDIPYIDTWSMTTVQPQKDVHADSWMIRQFLSLIFSHICPS